MSDMSREEAEARLRATEKHVEAVEANISATLERFAAKVDHLPSTIVLLFSVIGGIATAVGLMLAVYAYGGDRFDGGVQVATGLAQQTVEAQQLANKNAQQIEALIERSNKTDTQVEAIYKALVGNGGGKVPDGQNE